MVIIKMWTMLMFVGLIGSVSSNDLAFDEPAGPIIQEKGSEIRLKCGVKSGIQGLSRDNLNFYINSEKVESKYVHNVNETTIELVIPNAEEQEGNIMCKHNDSGINLHELKIGRKPDTIDMSKMKCRSFNWKDMNCTFDIPYNAVHVHYKMKYKIISSSQVYECNQPDKKDSKVFSCFIDDQNYRRAYPTFMFLLNSNNSLGSVDQNVTIDNYASIIPEALNFKIESISSNKVTLNWSPHHGIASINKPFVFEIIIRAPSCELNEKVVRINEEHYGNNPNSRNFSHGFALNYAHTWYDFKIRSRLSTTPDIEEMWSSWKNITEQTSMRHPDTPPSVDEGSFSVGATGDIYIYWKHLNKCQYNGNNISYTVSSSSKKSESPFKYMDYYAIYSKNDINLKEDTMFYIRSVNAKGASERASTVIIPSQERILEGPSKIKKIVANENYQISWSPPEHDKYKVTSYTVFWCSTKVEQPNKCEGSIDFVRRSPSELSYFHKTKSSESVNFAVSANSETSTSGMVWAKCTTAHSNEIGKIKTIWIPRLTSSTVEVEWKLECFDSGIVAGYQIEYCPSKEPKTLECMEKEKKLNITDKSESPKYTLTELMPYTTYKIIIRMFSNSTMGPPSEPLANTTLEAAPSEVRGLIARNVGNTSVDLLWDPPEFANGHLTYYNVWANGNKNELNIDGTTSTRMNFTLKNLNAFTKYDIAVEACTKECSNAARTMITTTIGSPGNFEKQPEIQLTKGLMNNYTSAALTWEKPKFKGGDLDYYEFKTKIIMSDDTIKESFVKLRSLECSLDHLCTGDSRLYEFSVRAVNLVLTPHSKVSDKKLFDSRDPTCNNDDQNLIRTLEYLKQQDPHGWHLAGPWSPAITTSCNIHANSQQIVFLMLSTIVSVIVAVFVIYSYRKIKEMKDIIVQMPPGLEDLTGDKMKKEKDLGNIEKNAKPDILRHVDSTSINCEDENGQLLKKSLNGSLNGADCSSSMGSDSSRSELDNIEQEDEIEYGEFANDQTRQSNDRLESFMINPVTPKDAKLTNCPPEILSASTPIADKFSVPTVVSNTKPQILQNGYVSQPARREISPLSPSNGYVSHALFNPIQSSGYTPFTTFNKPILTQNVGLNDKINSKLPIVATTDQEGISGYVTHKQLSDFGRQMQ